MGSIPARAVLREVPVEVLLSQRGHRRGRMVATALSTTTSLPSSAVSKLRAARGLAASAASGAARPVEHQHPSRPPQEPHRVRIRLPVRPWSARSARRIPGAPVPARPPSMKSRSSSVDHGAQCCRVGWGYLRRAAVGSVGVSCTEHHDQLRVLPAADSRVTAGMRHCPSI